MLNQSYNLALAGLFAVSGMTLAQASELMILPRATPNSVRAVVPKQNLLGLAYEARAITTLKCSGTLGTAQMWYSLVEYVSGSKGGPSTATALEELQDGCSYESGIPLAKSQHLLAVFSEPHYNFLIYETNGSSNLLISDPPQLSPQFSLASPNEFCFKIDVVADSSGDTAYVPKGVQPKPC